ncbi:MAG: hypothetical protein J6X03_01695 [Bacilli bacterium]|nr:hypothetical protein [Bacilli bacterium]
MKKLKQRIINLNLNPRNELLKFILIVVVGIAAAILIYIFLKSWTYFVIALLLIILFSYLFLGRYSMLEEDKRKRLEDEFVEMFSYLRIYLVNKQNVYQALKESSQFTSLEMKEEVNTFLKRVDEDKTVVPFIEFGKNLKNKVIEEVMISLYQMVDAGSTLNYLNQFIKLFENFQVRFKKEDLDRRLRRLDLFNTLSLLGVGYLMVIILLVIVTIIGDVTTNGF